MPIILPTIISNAFPTALTILESNVKSKIAYNPYSITLGDHSATFEWHQIMIVFPTVWMFFHVIEVLENLKQGHSNTSKK